jgi:hypothetical protein
MAIPALGDDRKKGGENVWISRKSIDLARREAQSVSSSETKARRTSSDRRKVEAREAQRDAARRNGGKPREHRKVGSRDGSEPRKGSVTGVGWKLRTKMVRDVSRRLPWSRRGRYGRGLSDTTTVCCQRVIVDAAPRSTGGLGRTVTRGCVASGHTLPLTFPLEPVTAVTLPSRGGAHNGGDKGRCSRAAAPAGARGSGQGRPEPRRTFASGDLAV